MSEEVVKSDRPELGSQLAQRPGGVEELQHRPDAPVGRYGAEHFYWQSRSELVLHAGLGAGKGSACGVEVLA